jgi:hypothetical protein
MTQGPHQPDTFDLPDATTVSEIVQRYQDQGFVMSFTAVEGGGVRCGSCRTVSDAGSVTVNAIGRAEGPSDPADMAMVAVVTCPWCSMAGTLVVGYGPSASPEDADVVTRLSDERPTGEAAVLTALDPPT